MAVGEVFIGRKSHKTYENPIVSQKIYTLLCIRAASGVMFSAPASDWVVLTWFVFFNFLVCKICVALVATVTYLAFVHDIL